MDDVERADLEAFTLKMQTALELGDLPFDIDTVLNLAGDAARAVLRPAAPLTTFLVGYAAGLAAGAGADPARAITGATDTAVATCNAE
ncbi:MAG: DUF6457 domain-containing protein [Terrimesophilobacter sp.]